MLRLFLIFLVIAIVGFSSVSVCAAPGRAVLHGAHADRSKMSKSCRACHRGMRMAITGEEDSCLNCHGSSFSRSAMQQKGYLSQQVSGLVDIGR